MSTSSNWLLLSLWVINKGYPVVLLQGGFITKNFLKSTAKDRCFFSASHHPTSVYKSIVFGEAVRLRRLNERKSDYLKSLVNLKDKCFRSNFNQKMTENMLEIAKHWEDRF